MSDTDIVIRLRLERSDICLEAAREIEHLRARIAELEAQAATLIGTLGKPGADEPAIYTHNVPPSAPPHNKE